MSFKSPFACNVSPFISRVIIVLPFPLPPTTPPKPSLTSICCCEKSIELPSFAFVFIAISRFVALASNISEPLNATLLEFTFTPIQYLLRFFISTKTPNPIFASCTLKPKSPTPAKAFILLFPKVKYWTSTVWVSLNFIVLNANSIDKCCSNSKKSATLTLKVPSIAKSELSVFLMSNTSGVVAPCGLIEILVVVKSTKELSVAFLLITTLPLPLIATVEAPLKLKLSALAFNALHFLASAFATFRSVITIIAKSKLRISNPTVSFIPANPFISIAPIVSISTSTVSASPSLFLSTFNVTVFCVFSNTKFASAEKKSNASSFTYPLAAINVLLVPIMSRTFVALLPIPVVFVKSTVLLSDEATFIATFRLFPVTEMPGIPSNTTAPADAWSAVQFLLPLISLKRANWKSTCVNFNPTLFGTPTKALAFWAPKAIISVFTILLLSSVTCFFDISKSK